MVAYSRKGGYGKVDLKEVMEVIEKYLPVGSRDKVILKELVYDYECMMRVINGENHVFWHEDGSETRRIRLY